MKKKGHKDQGDNYGHAHIYYFDFNVTLSLFMKTIERTIERVVQQRLINDKVGGGRTFMAKICF